MYSTFCQQRLFERQAKKLFTSQRYVQGDDKKASG